MSELMISVGKSDGYHLWVDGKHHFYEPTGLDGKNCMIDQDTGEIWYRVSEDAADE